MVGRGELTDKAWYRIEPLLPENGRPGKQWQDHQRVINGILQKLRTGAPWRDLAERYGPWQICYERSRVGDATALGTICQPTRKRNRMRQERWSGR